MIKSFADAAAADIFHGVNSKRARSIPKTLWTVVARKLGALNAATEVRDLASPGNNLEALKGDLAGFYSIRVNDQYRIVFAFAAGVADKVRVVDYH